MTWLNDTLSALRQVVLLEHRVSELEDDMRNAQGEIASHDRRIQQLETVIFGPVSPDRLRLPR
jgi:vacuolar-type H+-ATPase subunit D/Vma8